MATRVKKAACSWGITRAYSKWGTEMKKLSAEFFGTFWLVLGGLWQRCAGGGLSRRGHRPLAACRLAFGLTVLTMAYAVGGISGGHFNPAVSVGLATAGRFSWNELPGYVIAQVVGGAAGALVLYLIATGKADFSTAWAALPPMAMANFRRASFSLFAALHL